MLSNAFLVPLDQKSSFGLRGRLRRPLNVQWQRPVIPSLNQAQRNVLGDVATYDLFIGRELEHLPEYDQALAHAFRETAKAINLDTSYSIDWKSADFVYRVALRYCPTDPAVFALALHQALPGIQSSEINILTMAAYLHGVRITLDGVTFSFVVNIGYGLRDLILGVRVEKVTDVKILLPAMFACRKNITKSDPFLTGEAVFCADYLHTQNNYFNTSESFGLGFISMMAEDRSELIIKIVQDSLLLVELYRLTREEGNAGKKMAKELRLWKHLAMGMIEALASELGYRSIKARNHHRFSHLYGDLFSSRLGLDEKPAYELVTSKVVGMPSVWVSPPHAIILYDL